MKGICLLLLWSLFFCLPACRDKLALDDKGVPHELIVAAYQGDNPGDIRPIQERMKAYLSRKLGMPVEYLYSTDYTSVVEAIHSNKVHIAQLSPFSYVLATQKDTFQDLVVVSNDGKPTLYRSVIFTNPMTGIKSIDDLKARAKSLTLCFADPASTSGHLVPRAFLRSIGLDPETSFKEVMFAGSHAASVLTVKAGKVDIGCSFEYAVDMMVRKRMLDRKDLVTLWTSDPIVEGPIVARIDLNKDFVERVRQAFIDMPRDDSATFYRYVHLFRPNATGYGFMRAEDSMYDGVRKIASGIKDIDLKKNNH